MKLKIKDIGESEVKGVRFLNTGSCGPYREKYFEWTPFPMVSLFHNNSVMMGVLEGWHHVPAFTEIEYHEDRELFFFIEGTALMLFVDIENGATDMDSLEMIRIPAGTQMEIEQGKGHFVPVAEGGYFKALVVSPVQDAPRIKLGEMIVAEGLV